MCVVVKVEMYSRFFVHIKNYLIFFFDLYLADQRFQGVLVVRAGIG